MVVRRRLTPFLDRPRTVDLVAASTMSGRIATARYELGEIDSYGTTVEVPTGPPITGDPITFEARVRIDTPKERDYYEHGGILHYVLRQLAA